LQEQICNGLYTFPDEFWSDVSESAKDLIRKMMCVDPAQRLTIAGVLEHAWLADDQNVINRVDTLLYPTVRTAGKRAATNESTPMDDDNEMPVIEDFLSSRWKRMKNDT
jgi:serine/threonine protein kinase